MDEGREGRVLDYVEWAVFDGDHSGEILAGRLLIEDLNATVVVVVCVPGFWAGSHGDMAFD